LDLVRGSFFISGKRLFDEEFTFHLRKPAFLFCGYNLADRLGRRIRIRTKKFEEMHALLRELLLNGTQMDFDQE